MSTARIFESELVLLIVIQNSCQGEGGGGGGGGEVMINLLSML